jgi:hypothetical protein
MKINQKNWEGDGSLALGGCRLVARHNNQRIVGGSNRMDDGEDAWPGWSVWEGVFLISGQQFDMEYAKEVDIANDDVEYAIGSDGNHKPLAEVGVETVKQSTVVSRIILNPTTTGFVVLLSH